MATPPFDTLGPRVDDALQRALQIAGVASIRLGDFREASRHLIRAIEGAPRDAVLLNNAAYAQATHVVLMHNINDRLLLAFQNGYQSPLGVSGDTSWDKVREASNALVTAFWDFASYHSNLLFAARMQFARFHPFSGERLGPVVSEDTIDLEDPKLKQHALIYRAYVEAFIGLSKALTDQFTK